MSETTTNTQYRMPSLPHIEVGDIDWLPEELQNSLESRQMALEDFAYDPENPELWQAVTEYALEEEAKGTGQPDELRTIPATELIAFADTIRNTDPADRYALTTGYASNGVRWFDTLYGLHSPSGDTAIEAAAQAYTRKQGTEKVATAVDLATGTGKTAQVAAQFAEQTVGLDRDEALLEAAREEHPDIDFVHGSLDSLPFADSSVDIVTSDGIKYSLDAETARTMYSEIARVLKPGGVYIDTDYAEPDEIINSVDLNINHPDYHPEDLATFVTWKAVLEDMIVDTISGKVTIKDPLQLYGHEWDALKADLGLREFTLRAHPRARNKRSHARMLYKV